MISRKNEHGVALMIVLSAIVVLTMLAVEFAFNRQTEYRMANYQIRQLQAEYLARSAVNLNFLLMKYNQLAKNSVASSGLDSQLGFDLSAPLCEQFPLSTELLRSVAGGDAAPPEGETEAKGEKPTLLAGMQVMGGEEFLNFEGDFSGECKDESGKIDLNAFFKMDPEQKVERGDNAYDRYKKLIFSLLSEPKYHLLFEGHEPPLTDIVKNIGDWVDPNERINDYGGVGVGSEESEYNGAANSFGTKNGKFTTPGDIYRVPGVTEDWWLPVRDLFTIYGGGKVNVCRAEPDVVTALVLQYTNSREDIPPLRPEDKELLDTLVGTVQHSCQGVRPDPNQITTDLNAKIAELLRLDLTAAQQQGTARINFADLIETQSRFFYFSTTGVVDDVTVHITTVLDLGEGAGTDTRKWKILYWRVD